MSTVVLLSGGMDSTVALYWAIGVYGEVSALSIHYRQRHKRELEAAAAIAKLAGVKHERKELVVPWPPMAGDVLPGRNGFLLMTAAMHAAARGGTEARVVVGCCGADAAGFTDCRPEFLLSMGQSLTLGLGVPTEIVAPLVDRTKAQTVRVARQLGAWDALALSWTCYRGDDAPCGECNACKHRAAGFAEAGEVDPWHA